MDSLDLYYVYRVTISVRVWSYDESIAKSHIHKYRSLFLISNLLDTIELNDSRIFNKYNCSVRQVEFLKEARHTIRMSD